MPARNPRITIVGAGADATVIDPGVIVPGRGGPIAIHHLTLRQLYARAAPA